MASAPPFDAAHHMLYPRLLYIWCHHFILSLTHYHNLLFRYYNIFCLIFSNNFLCITILLGNYDLWVLPQIMDVKMARSVSGFIDLYCSCCSWLVQRTSTYCDIPLQVSSTLFLLFIIFLIIFWFPNNFFIYLYFLFYLLFLLFIC